MLDAKKKYYVYAGTNLRSVVESWANGHGMKLIGDECAIPGYDRVFELDVRYNDDLKISLRLIGSGQPKFMDGGRTIGSVVYNGVGSRVVVFPMIEDR